MSHLITLRRHLPQSVRLLAVISAIFIINIVVIKLQDHFLQRKYFEPQSMTKFVHKTCSIMAFIFWNSDAKVTKTLT